MAGGLSWAAQEARHHLAGWAITYVSAQGLRANSKHFLFWKPFYKLQTHLIQILI
jgi:hypothetical protein